MKWFKKTNAKKPAPPAAKPAPKPKQTKEEKPMSKAPYESGDLAKDHASAKEDLNRSSVHVTDSIRNAFDRMGKNPDAKHLPAMRAIQKTLEAALEDINDLGAVKETKKSKKDD